MATALNSGGLENLSTIIRLMYLLRKIRFKMFCHYLGFNLQQARFRFNVKGRVSVDKTVEFLLSTIIEYRYCVWLC